MLFNSFSFLVFLPLTLLAFAAYPERFRWACLLIASCVFYGALAPANLLYVFATTLVIYVCGWAIEHATSRGLRNALLTLGLLIVLGSLASFKLYDFAAGQLETAFGWPGGAWPRLHLTAPAGFSFYAFSAASYLVDVHARRLRAEAHAGNVALYLAYFSKILAGPIERATTFLPQLHQGPRFQAEQLVPALQLIVWGLFKKVVIADNIAGVVDHGFGIVAYATPVDLLFSAYFFAFQIYCDFSGYTDIAIGVSLLFGIRLMENFRRPYLSRSTAEFWSERWHISLGRWFRDYLYIPLGGSRVSVPRRYLNVMLVFAVSGLWHAGLGYGVGWTFLIWGGLNGLYQWAGLATTGVWRRLGTMLPRLRDSAALRVLRALLTFHLITFAWVFFRAASIADAWRMLRRIGESLPTLPALLTRYPYSADQKLGVLLILLLLLYEILDERRPISERLARAPLALRWTAYYACIFALLLVGHWHGREFIYMQF